MDEQALVIDDGEDYSSLQRKLLEEQLILEVSARCPPFLRLAGDQAEAVREFADLWRKCLKGQGQGNESGSEYFSEDRTVDNGRSSVPAVRARSP